MIVHHAYRHTSALGTTQAPKRKSVPLHCASRHVERDLTVVNAEIVLKL
jgi:hypothetical protein